MNALLSDHDEGMATICYRGAAGELNVAIEVAMHTRPVNVLRDDPNFDIDVGMLSELDLEHTIPHVGVQQRQIREFDMQHALVADSSISDTSSTVFTRDSVHTAGTVFSGVRSPLGSVASIGPLDDIMNQSLGQLEFSFDEHGNVVANAAGDGVGDVLDVDLNFDLEEPILPEQPQQPDIEVSVVDMETPKRRRIDAGRLKLRRIVCDAEISISTAKMKEDRERYSELMLADRSLPTFSFMELVGAELQRLPPFMQLLLHPATANKMSRSYSRASSVSSLEEARRALSGQSSRRGSISSAHIRFEEPIQEMSPVAFENDDAMLDISFGDASYSRDENRLHRFYQSLVEKCRTHGNGLVESERSDLMQISFGALLGPCARKEAVQQFSYLLELCSNSMVYLEPIGANGRSKWELLQPENINIVAQV
ncbi:hypothetical protein KL910_003489 [Ogataea haglerorum]|nr:hypothetical protein KL910_003489 [Ogataea haglerorum]KAG7790092.1 hypothetical protein KL945_001630 [Ogataea haglerorum]